MHEVSVVTYHCWFGWILFCLGFDHYLSIFNTICYMIQLSCLWHAIDWAQWGRLCFDHDPDHQHYIPAIALYTQCGRPLLHYIQLVCGVWRAACRLVLVGGPTNCGGGSPFNVWPCRSSQSSCSLAKHSTTFIIIIIRGVCKKRPVFIVFYYEGGGRSAEK